MNARCDTFPPFCLQVSSGADQVDEARFKVRRWRRISKNPRPRVQVIPNVDLRVQVHPALTSSL